jgi:3',5'-cyclic AMP phosphodiesterase CpdA
MPDFERRRAACAVLLALALPDCSQEPPSNDVTPPAGSVKLLGAPFLFSPTASGFGVNAVLEVGTPADLSLQVRQVGAEWSAPTAATVRAPDVAQWSVSGLAAGSRYDYRLVEGAPKVNDTGDELITVFEGSGITQKPAGAAYTFALLSDSHIGYDLAFSNQGDPLVLADVGESIAQLKPDFIANLGDLVDFHQFGFNAAPPDGSITRGAYLNYRQTFGAGFASAPHFNVIGNWEGENGNYSSDTIQWSRDARMLYMPGPDPTTYPLGGSPWQDYYAFSWGDATFFVLNVMTYTPTEHLLDNTGGEADDWTLGAEQMAWFEAAVQQADSRWKFVMIHHAVGGKAGNEANSRYGRGGGLAANVGEQAIVHQLMRDYGVQVFFYGHDHVFVDMTVDGIHYTQPGSAGAPWKFTTDETGYEDFWYDSGWAKVDVAPESVHVTFFSVNGDTLYDYSL